MSSSLKIQSNVDKCLLHFSGIIVWPAKVQVDVSSGQQKSMPYSVGDFYIFICI